MTEQRSFSGSGDAAMSAKGRAGGRPSPKQRRRAREKAVQALYQQLLNYTPVDALEAQFMEDPVMLKLDLDYFRRLVRGVSASYAELDALFGAHTDRPVDELDPVEHAILRLGAYELKYCKDVPLPVVMNESIELAKLYGATDGHKFINGVLDRLASELRAEEVAVVRAARSRRGRN